MADRLNLTKCPLTNVRRKAQDILNAVAGGIHPLALGGQLLKSMDKTAISVPVGHSYRLLFAKSTLEPISFLTHEQYNKRLRHPAGI
jgi:hypothetical protein